MKRMAKKKRCLKTLNTDAEFWENEDDRTVVPGPAISIPIGALDTEARVPGALAQVVFDVSDLPPGSIIEAQFGNGTVQRAVKS
jgi:hypothetical protein